MGHPLELRTIVRYETMNGREVPIYRVTRYTQEDVEIANREAAKKLEEELGKPSSFNEVVKILHEHADDIKKEGSPAAQEELVQKQEDTHE